jgi:hypothetical protein
MMLRMPAPTVVDSGSPRRLWRGWYLAIYSALAVSMPLTLRHAYHPHTGFSSLIWFGDRSAPRRLETLRNVPVYTLEQSKGYDGQFYAQIAVAGNPLDRRLDGALDSVGYRARRALLPVAAYAVGLGRPAWILQVYALSNAVCWLLLAMLLARWWFPPTDLHNLIRWAGTLFGTGALVSVMRSLPDLPALLVVALAARALELNRRKLAATLFGLAGLVRETSVLAAPALLPQPETPRRWRRALVAVVLCCGPTLVWGAVLALRHGHVTGARNFALPFAGVLGRVRTLAALERVQGFSAGVRGEIWAVLALGTQAGFMLLRPRPANPWWRLGAPFALLFLLLGGAVWEGEPSAATRVVLPLTLAFNVLAPRGRRALLLLAAGNLTLLSAATNLSPLASEQTVYVHGVTASPGAGWGEPEQRDGRSWRWASGSMPAVLRFHNPTPDVLAVTLEFQLSSIGDRRVTVAVPGTIDDVEVRAGRRVPVRLGPFALPPGETDVTFDSREPPWSEQAASGRKLSFAVHELYAEVVAAPEQ